MLASLPLGLMIPPPIPPVNSGCAWRKADGYGHSIQHALYFSIICGSESKDSGRLWTIYGGGRGIRTPGTLSGTTVFKTAGINRSPIPPRLGKVPDSLVYRTSKSCAPRFLAPSILSKALIKSPYFELKEMIRAKRETKNQPVTAFTQNTAPSDAGCCIASIGSERKR